MKILRKYRRTKRVARRTGVAALATSLLFVLGACMGDQNGVITEVESGENGVKVEWNDPDRQEDRETYLKPDSGCAEQERIQECATPADVLVPADQTATEQGVEPAMFRDCRHAEAINSTPLRKDAKGWNPALDKDSDGVACE